MPVHGVPVLRRLVLLAKKTGTKDIFCLYHPRYRQNIELVSDLLPRENFVSATSFMDDTEKIMKRWFKNSADIIVSKGNTVIDRLSFQNLVSIRSNKPVLLVDPAAQGKSSWMLKMPHAVNTAMDAFTEVIKKILFSDTLPEKLLKESTVIFASSGFPFSLSDNPRSVADAEKRLIDSLGLQTAKTDGFMARNFDRYISRFFSKRLVSTGIHPNWFTVIGMSIGLVGAWFLSHPGYAQRLIGSFLFVFCIMVDGVDGEIARLTLKESTFGHYFDIVTDNIVHAAIFLALPVSFYRETGNPVYLKSLWILLIGVAFAAFSAYYCIFRFEERYSGKILTVFDKLASRDFAYLIALLAIFDKLEWFLWGATIGSYLFGMALWMIYLQSSPLTGDDNKV